MDRANLLRNHWNYDSKEPLEVNNCTNQTFNTSKANPKTLLMITGMHFRTTDCLTAYL